MKLSYQVQEAVSVIKKACECAEQVIPHPHTLLILGSGLGSLSSLIDEYFSLSYDEIPHFSSATAPGHQGKFVFGSLAGVEVVCMCGRLHLYEGNTPLQTVFPLLVAHALGARRLVVTNAAGAINTGFKVGDIMLILDHVNYTGASPITLDADNDLLNSCFDMTYAYTPKLQQQARDAARALEINLHEGVYLGLRGPMFETPAEIRMFRTWGVDAVGMSTVHEVLMASALGMEICGLSLLTNMAAGILDQAITVEEVAETAEVSGATMARLVEQIMLTSHW